MKLEPEHISNLTIEIDDGDHVILEQDSTGNVSRIWVHSTQLRYIAEKAGLSEAADQEAQQTIAKLKRRLRLLRDRIAHLDEYLEISLRHAHDDHDYERAFSEGTSALAYEFCADLDIAPRPIPTTTEVTQSAPLATDSIQ